MLTTLEINEYPEDRLPYKAPCDRATRRLPAVPSCDNRTQITVSDSHFVCSDDDAPVLIFIVNPVIP